MSDGEQTIAVGHAPEFAVVGEPASEPHQAVVVGEPVPLANGHPTIPPPGEEPAVNGFQEVSHLQHHQDEAAEGNPNTPCAPAEETPSPSDAPVEETPSAPDAPAPETSNAPDSPADENPSAAEERNATVPPADAAEAPNAAVVSAESPDPVEVSPEIPIENPCLPLEEASAAHKDAPSKTLTVDPVAEEESLIEPPLASAVPDENAFPTQVELSYEGSGASQSIQQEGLPVKEAISTPATQEEPASSQIVLEGASATGSKVSEAAQEEALAVEPSQISQRDAPLQEAVGSDIVPEKPIDEEAKEIELTEEVPSVKGTKIIESPGAESHAREPDEAPLDGSSVDPSLEVARVTSDVVSQAEGSTNADQIPQKDPLHEDTPLLDSHQVQNHVEAVVASSFETPIRSQTTQKVFIEEHTPDQSPTEEPLVEETTLKQTPLEGAESSQDNVPAAIGENSFQSVEDDNHVVEREQDFSKDDENAEGKEKPSSRIRLPLIVTGLAIAAVGVAVASISRTH